MNSKSFILEINNLKSQDNEDGDVMIQWGINAKGLNLYSRHHATDGFSERHESPIGSFSMEKDPQFTRTSVNRVFWNSISNYQFSK